MCRMLSYLGKPIPIEQLFYQPDNSFIKQTYHPKYMMHLLLKNIFNLDLEYWKFEEMFNLDVEYWNHEEMDNLLNKIKNDNSTETK